MVQTPLHRYCEFIVKPISMVNNLNMIYCNNGIGYFSPLRCHRIISTWSIFTNEVSKLLWYNFLLHALFTFAQWLIVFTLWAYKNKLRYFFEMFIYLCFAFVFVCVCLFVCLFTYGAFEGVLVIPATSFDNKNL